MIARALVTSLLFLAPLPQAAPPPRSAPPPVPAGTFPDHFEPGGQQIFFAVLEGLYRDGVTNEVVDKIIATDDTTQYPANFVWACPVCMPAYEAFCVYRGRPKFHDKMQSDTFGPGLPADQVQRLVAVDLAVSQSAIEDLIRVWMDRRMDALRLTEAERSEWRMDLEKRRKQGMSYLDGYKNLGGSYASMKTCPICEGANASCKAR